MEGMREIAKSYYDRASEAEKISTKQSFAKLDVDGDGKISLSEFKKTVKLWLSADAVFAKLDKNGDGYLDFEEFLCLHYMEKKVDIGKCSGCSELLVGPYFSCLLCFERGNNKYDLCCTCYRRGDELPHEHSMQSMMDHHSLIMVFRNRTAAAAEKSQKKREMEEIREIARSYYTRASEAEKLSIKQSFAKLDVDSNGKISLKEFMIKGAVSSWVCRETVFEKLDENGDGSLDFDEFLCLYYMQNKVPIHTCDGCMELQFGNYFSCLCCLERDAFFYDLCYSCYRRGAGQPHKHSVQYMIDHHSLLKRFMNRIADEEKARIADEEKEKARIADEEKARIADEKKAQNKKGIEELRIIAIAHYQAGSPQVKDLANKFYLSMDTDGDRQVDLSEFLAFMKQIGYPFMQNRSFFDKLDLNNKGTLDFFDVMTLYYIIKSGRPFCGCCAEFIPGIFFSCVECFNNPKTSFYLCCDCYQMAKSNHNHDGRSQFLDNYAFLQAMRDPEVAYASGVNSIETGNKPTLIQLDSTVHIHNAIVPAPSKSNWSKRKAAYYALDIVIGSVSKLACTIM